MVSHTLKFILGLTLLSVSVRAELQLTPEPVDYDLDGIKMRRLAFPDGSQHVTYTPPQGWDYSGSANRLTLRPGRFPQAEGTVTHSGLAQPQTFDEDTMKRLAEEAISSLPGEARHAVLVSQEKNPLLIERKETFLVVINYDYLNESYARSILFLNRNNEQFRFQLTCRRADFPELQKAFLASQFTWQNL